MSLALEDLLKLGSREELREAARRELARERFLDFIGYTFPGYHVGAVQRLLAGKLQAFEAAVAERRSPRLMIFLPPRSGKSEAVSRRFPPWVLGRHPDWSVILATYGAELSEELSGDARAIVMSEEFGNVFGRTYTEDVSEVVELDRGRKSVQAWRIARRRGGMRATGVGGAITGRGADVLILDDLIKSRKEADSDGVREDSWNWYRSTARTRLEPGAGIVFLSTRWHHDDPAGRLLAAAEEGAGADQWEVIKLPAIAEEEGDALGRSVGEALDPVRFDREALARIRADVGSREWAALYQQNPTPEEGSIFKEHWFGRADPRTERPLAVYQFWDTAFTRTKRSDRSVCGTWKVYPERYRLDDVFYGRLEMHQVKAEAKRLAELYRPRAVVVEDEGNGKILLQEWRRESRLPILGYPSRRDGDKIARANAVTPILEAGKVEVPREAPWMRAFFEEVLAFPEWEHDDMADMLSMSLACMGVRSPGTRKLSTLRDFRVVLR